MKALITGGTGFIGSQVTDVLLAQGHSVRLFSRAKDIPVPFRGKNLEVTPGNLHNPQSLIDALDGTDVLFHIGEIKNRTKAASEKNVLLLKTILPYLKSKHVGRIVFISSITVSGMPSEIPADEETPPKFVLNDHYTDYKRTCEELLRNGAGDFEYAVIRPAPVYGPGSRYLGRFIDILNTLGPVGIPFAGNAQNLAPLIHVKDLAKAIAGAGTAPPASGQTFIITDGLKHSWFDFFKTVTAILGKNLRILPVPPLLLQMSVIPFDLISYFIGINIDPVNYIKYFSQDIHFDAEKAKRLLDWQPQFSLTRGVEDMLDFYRKT